MEGGTETGMEAREANARMAFRQLSSIISLESNSVYLIANNYPTPQLRPHQSSQGYLIGSITGSIQRHKGRDQDFVGA